MNDERTTLPTGTPLRALALAGVLFLCPGFGWAQPSPLETVQSLGLLGTWSASCTDGASEANVFVTFYGTRKGMLRRRLDRGSDAMKLDGAVDSASALEGKQLRMRLRNDDDNWGPSNGQVYDTLIDLSGGKLHTISSIDRAGVELVKAGRFVSSGVRFPTLRRCSR